MRSGSSHSGGKDAWTWPGYQGYSRAPAQPPGGPRSRPERPRTSSAARRWRRSGSRPRSADLPRSRPRRSGRRPCPAPGRSRRASRAPSRRWSRSGGSRRGGSAPRSRPRCAVGMPSRASGPASSRKLAWSDLWRFSAHHEIVRGICWNSSSPQRSASSTAARRSGSAGNSGGSGWIASSSRETFREPCTLRPSTFIAGTRSPAKPNSRSAPRLTTGGRSTRRYGMPLCSSISPRRDAGVRAGDDVELDLHAVTYRLNRRLVLAEHLAHHAADLAERGAIAQRVLDRVEQVAAAAGNLAQVLQPLARPPPGRGSP